MVFQHDKQGCSTTGERRVWPAWLPQVARYFIVGILDTIIDIGLYYLLTRLALGVFALPLAAKAVSFSASTVNSFFWNRAFTFRSRAAAGLALPLFVVFNLFGLLVNAGLLDLNLHVLGITELVAVELANLASGVINFTGSKFVVFGPGPRILSAALEHLKAAFVPVTL